jgi:hypothetical protein
MSSDPSKESPTESKADKAKHAFGSFLSKTKEVSQKTAETVKEKGKEFDEKHGQRIIEKTKEVAGNIAQKTKEVAGKLKPKPKEEEGKSNK